MTTDPLRSGAGEPARPKFIADILSWQAQLSAIDRTLGNYAGTDAVILDPELLKAERIAVLDRQRRELIEKLKPSSDSAGLAGKRSLAGANVRSRETAAARSIWKQLQAVCSPPQETITDQPLDDDYVATILPRDPQDPNYWPPSFGVDTSQLRTTGLAVFRAYLNDPEPMYSNIHLWTVCGHALKWRLPPNVLDGWFEVSIRVRHTLDFVNATVKQGWVETTAFLVDFDEDDPGSFQLSLFETVMIQRQEQSGQYQSQATQLTRAIQVAAGTSTRRVVLGHKVSLMAHSGYVEAVGRFATHSTTSGDAPRLRCRFMPA